jgi:hypothetical protein
MNRHPLILIMLLTVLLLSAAPNLRAQDDTRCFDETGYCISGRLLAFWEANNGLRVFGLPISPQREEVIEGQPRQAQ